MQRVFFPDVGFAWAFCVGLVLLIGVAAWTDTTRAKIPNRLVLVILALGMVMNGIRAGWLAADGKPLWWLESGAAWRGVIDGLLYSLLGFVVAFVVMFVIWIMGSCGGGDVKLMAAVSAWVGLSGFLFLWLGSVIVLFFWVAAKVLSGGMSPRGIKRTLSKVDAGRKAHDQGKEQVVKKGKLRVTFSLPLLITTVCVLLWVYRYELELQVRPRPQEEHSKRLPAHDRPTHSINPRA